MTKTLQTILITLFLNLGLAFIITSCKVKPAIVEKKPPQPVNVKVYPKSILKDKPINLNKNKSFLWKPEGQMNSDQVRDIQKISSDMDQLDEDQKEIEIPLEQLGVSYDEEFEKFNDEQKDYWNRLPENISNTEVILIRFTDKYNTSKDNLEKEQSNLESLVQKRIELDEILQEEKSKPAPEQDKIKETEEQIALIKIEEEKSLKLIEKWSKDVDKYETKVRTTKEELESYLHEKSTTYNIISKLDEDIKAEEERIAPIREEFNRRGSELIENLTKSVDLLEDPNYLQIKLVNEELQIDLNWKLKPKCVECSTFFSTTDGSIQNVKYIEKGGVLEFEITLDNEHYQFHFVRAGAQDKHRRLIYNGDLTITYANGSQRFGVLKFMSSSEY